MKRKPADGKKSSVLRAFLLCALLSALAGGLCFAAALSVWGVILFVCTGFFLLGAALFAFFAPPEETDPENGLYSEVKDGLLHPADVNAADEPDRTGITGRTNDADSVNNGLKSDPESPDRP